MDLSPHTWTLPLTITIRVGTPVPAGGSAAAPPPTGPALSPPVLTAPGAAPVSTEGVFSRSAEEKASPPSEQFMRHFDAGSLLHESFEWRTALSLALAAKVAYGGPADVDQRMRNWGFSRWEFISEDDTQCFIAATSDCVLVSFRGTENLGDWMANLNILTTTRFHGRVHRGFLGAFKVVEKRLLAFLAKNAGLPVALTGHSLGGALALIAAAEWQGRMDIRHVHTFGQPRAGRGSFPAFLTEKYGAAYRRFVNDDDIVPMIPPTLRHAGKLHHFNSDGDLESAWPADALDAPGVEPEEIVEETPEMAEEEFDQIRASLLLERARRAASGLDKEPLGSAEHPEVSHIPTAGPQVEGILPSVSDHSMDHYVAKTARQAGV